MSYISSKFRFKVAMALALTFVFIFSLRAEEQKAKYIFLMIGDGMGINQRAAAEEYKRHSLKLERDDPKGKLIMNSFPVKGLTTTSSTNSKTPDSASAATALACGEKTRNYTISMDESASRKLKAITFDAQEKGMKVGIVSSVGLDHATPACFYASAPNRGMKYEIAMQIPKSNFNYFAGGYIAGNGKAEGREKPVDAIKKAGYTFLQSKEDFNALKRGDDKVVVEANIGYRIDKTNEHFLLSELTEKGIELLDNPNGFFMMIEGGRIDWSGHANDIGTNIKEVLAFDDAVASVYEFYKKHPKETLIVVTGDHETGGLKTAFTGEFKPEVLVEAVDNQRTSGSRFAGRVNKWKELNIGSEAAMKELIDAFGLKNITKAESKKLKEAVDYYLSHDPNDKRSEAYKKMYGNKNVAINTMLSIIAQRAGVVWTSFGHSSSNVKTTAIGCNAEAFGGLTDNTDIAKKLQLMINLK